MSVVQAIQLLTNKAIQAITPIHSLSTRSTKKVKHKVANVLWLPHSAVSGMVITLRLTLGIVNVY